MVLQPDLGVCERVLTDARLAHVNIPNWARHLLPLARELGLTIACDVQDVIDTADPYRQDFIAFADILFFSAANQGDPAPLMTAFLETNPDQIVVAGNGARGCALGTSDGIEYYAALDIGGPVIDTNGAGDALAVGFLTSYVLNGYSLRDSILRGQIAARFTCTRKASTSNLITPETLEQHYLALRKTAVNDA
jgi:sugar/nucleoside kinase (ribokinase family)